MTKRAAVQDRSRVCKKSKSLALVEGSCPEVALIVEHSAADVPLLLALDLDNTLADEIRAPSHATMPPEAEIPACATTSTKGTMDVKMLDKDLMCEGFSGAALSQAEVLRRAVFGFEKSLVQAVESLQLRLSDALKQKAVLESKNVSLSNLRANAAIARRKFNDDSAALAARKAECASMTEQRQECRAALDLQLAIIRDGATVFVNGTFEKPTDPKHVSALMTLFEKVGLTDTLVSSFPPAAARLPAERTDFMKTVICQVEQDLLAHITSLEAKLAIGGESVLELEAATTTARQSAVTAEALLEDSLRHHAAQSVEEAQAAADAMTEQIATLTSEFNAARRSAEDFVSGPGAALREWSQSYDGAAEASEEVVDDSARFGGA